MALRNIVKIDEDKCNGCGLCVNGCAEGAIDIVDGKAKLVSEVYCDGLGACIGHCPQGAISVEKRQADAFDEKAVQAHLAGKRQQVSKEAFVCPGTMANKLRESEAVCDGRQGDARSELGHWPVQLKLVSPAAPYFEDAHLLLVGDCVPFAMGDFHSRFLKGRSVVVGCPKLDNSEYYIDKLADILKANHLKGLTVVHMEVPCCSGLVRILQKAIEKSEVNIEFKDVTVSLQGEVLKSEIIT